MKYRTFILLGRDGNQDRPCVEFPWESKALGKPWKDGYTRVSIPLTEQEKRNSNKTHHVQIVRLSRLQAVRKLMPKRRVPAQVVADLEFA